MPASTVSSFCATSQHTSGPQRAIGKTSSKKRPIKNIIDEKASAAIEEASAALKAKNDGPILKPSGVLNDVMRRRRKACEHLLPACYAKMKKYPSCQLMVEHIEEAWACRCCCDDYEVYDKLIVAILDILIIIGKNCHSRKKYENIGKRASQAGEYAMSTKEYEFLKAFVSVRQLASEQACIVDDKLKLKQRKQHHAQIID